MTQSRRHPTLPGEYMSIRYKLLLMPCLMPAAFLSASIQSSAEIIFNFHDQIRI